MEYSNYLINVFESEFTNFNSLVSEFDSLCSLAFSALDYNLYMPTLKIDN